MDVDSGIDTMEVDDVDQQRAEAKRKRVRAIGALEHFHHFLLSLGLDEP